MVEKRGLGIWLSHAIMILGVLIVFFPIWLAFVASTVTQPEIVSPPMPLLPGDQFFINYKKALLAGVNVPVGTMLTNSLIMAIGIAIGKIIISLLSAFAIVYFRFPGKKIFFWLIFITLMLPVEVRIVPTYEIIAGFGMLNSYGGLKVPHKQKKRGRLWMNPLGALLRNTLPGNGRIMCAASSRETKSCLVL